MLELLWELGFGLSHRAAISLPLLQAPSHAESSSDQRAAAYAASVKLAGMHLEDAD